MTSDKIKNYLGQVAKYVIDNNKSYPSHLDESVIKNISIHFDENVSEYLYNNGVLGICLKEAALANEWKNAKLYDILISIKAIETTATSQNINIDTVLKSIITHEFMHAISVGFPGDKNEDYEKDEQHTDYFAQEVFESLNENEEYYSPYTFNSKIEDKNRSAYFNGSKDFD